MASMRSFYAALGWAERPGSNDEFVSFDAGGVLLTLYPLGRLSDEAAPGAPLPESDWRGNTIGINVGSVQEVDEVLSQAHGAGGRPVADPVKREWGGYSGYFSDPEGNRWEITWSPY
jgi:hypothetical protein